MLHCYKRQKMLCLCEICFYLKEVYDEGIYICKRYKKRGTPKYPLETMPTKCECFGLDKYLANYLEKECHVFSFIEKDLTPID